MVKRSRGVAEGMSKGIQYLFTKNKIEQSNWNAEWEKNFEPVLVDDLLLIRAPFHQEVKKQRSILYCRRENHFYPIRVTD